jgi:uncharacterized protein YdeI (YjbR/CyaY-like superfamily)
VSGETKAGLPVIPFESRRDWEAWLRKNHAAAAGLWIRFARKDAAVPSVSHAEALDAALCYGWIDGQAASLDDRFWLLRFTRRGPRSKWSRINRERAEALVREGRMRAPGLEAMEAARGDGRFQAAYESQRTIAVPDDLRQRLAADPRAERFFARLDSKNRYAILYRIHGAKKAETRARRIEQFVAMLAKGEVVHPEAVRKRPGPTSSSTG